MRLGLPSPFDDLPHTADVGVRVRGEDLAEAYGRAALALAQLLAGGADVRETEERELAAAGADRAELLVDFCRAVLGLFHVEQRLLAAVDVFHVEQPSPGPAAKGTAGRLRARVWLEARDPVRHAEGMDVKAVTYARAAVEPRPGGGWEATLIFDV